MTGPSYVRGTPADSPLAIQDVMALADYGDLSTAKLAVGDPAFPFRLPVLEELRHTSKSISLSDFAGGGASGDAADYAIEREYEDVASVVDAIDEPVNLLGHSYGARCSWARLCSPRICAR